MKLLIDISKDRYDEIMSMDWKNCRLIFDEEIRAIHDGKALEQEPSSSEKSNKWIPLDEKEPKDGQLILVTLVNRYKKRYVKIAEFIEENYRKHDGKIDQRYYGFQSVGNIYEWADEAVAWMSLPEPYQSEIPTGEEVRENE